MKKQSMSRRSFLMAGATTMVSSVLPELNASVTLELQNYKKKKIISFTDLKEDEPFYFAYPYDEDNSFIVKLGEVAAGGLGKQNDIVAFNQFCTHMGVSLCGTYKKEHKAMGACPAHLTSFDLTRHGMVIAGHATEALPQVQLEINDGIIYATGISGLMYGYNDNLDKGAK
ncbi:Arsenite oxidase small subunit precursor [hydrothermal vent metagenome]|uniref:Arsenite oxidase small subunit n=1 Tax=hydrothermal vent metagenome TaxID=652676 RepID=A0A1W1CUB9_9ZZZZ